MTTFKVLLHKIDRLELLQMKTKMTKKRKKVLEEEREVEKIITKKPGKVHK